jgi:hypothetical protein
LSEPSNLERRLRRLAVLVPMLAVAGAVFGFLPRGVVLVEHSFKSDAVIGTHMTHAGGYSVATWAVLHCFTAATVRAAPTRNSGWGWFAASLLFAFGGGIAWFVESFTLSSVVPLWPAHVTMVCVGSALVLVTFVLPVILVVSKSEAPAPEARVVTPRA